MLNSKSLNSVIQCLERTISSGNPFPVYLQSLATSFHIKFNVLILVKRGFHILFLIITHVVFCYFIYLDRNVRMKAELELDESAQDNLVSKLVHP